MSTLTPNGRVPRELWSCVFPRDVPNKSFGLQFAMIINAQGSEICCCLGAGTSQVKDSDVIAQNQRAWQQLRRGLSSVPVHVQRRVEESIRHDWQFRKSWLGETGGNDFNSLSDWLTFAASENGAAASISRNLTPDELERQGDRLFDRLAHDAESFSPLFLHIYGAPMSSETDGSVVSHVPDLHPRLIQQLTQLRGELMSEGALPSMETLAQHYTTFRQRFGPDVLRSLEGDQLLMLLKDTGHDGLVYWLEFKDDDEFPAYFGSIAGGSSLKYGVYRRRETGAWMTGSPTAQRELSTAEALQIARAHRDQLLAACDVLTRFRPEDGDEGYDRLQRELTAIAPDIEDSAWGHKYLSLLYPDKLDDFHAQTYQRAMLIKLLQAPVEQAGRYANAGRFVTLCRAFDWPMNHFTTVLNRRSKPHRYWRVGTRDGTTNQSHWETMRDGSFIAVGWTGLGDLSEVLTGENTKEAVRKRLTTAYPGSPQTIGRSAQQLVHFCETIQPRDYVLACDGAAVLGIGRVEGSYFFDASGPFPHRRRVEWLDIGEWRLPTTEGLQTTVHEYRRHTENLIAIERRVLEAPQVKRAPAGGPTTPLRTGARSLRWTEGGPIGRIQDALDRKGQVILYGPPGTGKTYWAELAANALAALWNLGLPYTAVPEADQARINGPGPNAFVRSCCFHPGYGYEDFIEGYRPAVVTGTVHFAREDGVFKALCDTAAGKPEHRYYLIVDEINRGDIPRIFGELITLLDKPKRGSSTVLPLSRQSFAVPPNVFVIGTMNTADRSIALLDTALRRRFGFIELMPDPATLRDTVVRGIALGPWLTAVNRLITTHVGRDGRNLQIGHSYLLDAGRPIHDFEHLSRVLREDVLPLLEEYCYDDWETLQRILGSGLVDVANRRFKVELFATNREDELVQAILASTPDVGGSPIAVAADVIDQTAASEPDGEGDDES